MTDHKFHWHSLLEDNSGGFSSSGFTMIVWSIGVFAVWAFATVWAVVHATPGTPVTVVAIPGEVITVLLGVMGLKVTQRFGEKGDVAGVDKIEPPKAP